MSYARENGYSVFTNDLDFSAILVSTRAEDARPEANLDHAANALVKFSAAIEQGALITIDTKKTRLHILPFTLSKNSV